MPKPGLTVDQHLTRFRVCLSGPTCRVPFVGCPTKDAFGSLYRLAVSAELMETGAGRTGICAALFGFSHFRHETVMGKP